MRGRAGEILPPRITKRRIEQKNNESPSGEKMRCLCGKSIKFEARCREQGGSGDRVTDGRGEVD